jgi:hypothetical protein
VLTNPTGHNLGTISGTGTLRATTSTLPLGNYTSFVSSAGGTIEYSPSADINMNVNRTVYNHLSIAGSNIISIPNLASLTLNGSLNVGASATLSNTGFNKDFSVEEASPMRVHSHKAQGTVTITGASPIAELIIKVQVPQTSVATG